MYGIYGDIIEAAREATRDADELEKLLEYPEIQADKAEYLSVLSRYNALNALREKLNALLKALCDEDELNALLFRCDGDERDAIREELFRLKAVEAATAASLADALGRKHARERVFGKMKFGAQTHKIGELLYAQIKAYMLSGGARIEDEKLSRKDGYTSGVSFIIEGEDALALLSPLTGAHKVYLPAMGSEEVRFAATYLAKEEEARDKDLKIDLFHSSGAGGQNVNKVETAVRVTHMPTGLVVVCQDERSQLKNKERAVETIKKRLRDMREEQQKKRVDEDIRLQFNKKNTPISFDVAAGTMTDTRLTSGAMPFPLADFGAYINSLLAL